MTWPTFFLKIYVDRTHSGFTLEDHIYYHQEDYTVVEYRSIIKYQAMVGQISQAACDTMHLMYLELLWDFYGAR